MLCTNEPYTVNSNPQIIMPTSYLQSRKHANPSPQILPQVSNQLKLCSCRGIAVTKSRTTYGQDRGENFNCWIFSEFNELRRAFFYSQRAHDSVIALKHNEREGSILESDLKIRGSSRPVLTSRFYPLLFNTSSSPKGL